MTFNYKCLHERAIGIFVEKTDLRHNFLTTLLLTLIVSSTIHAQISDSTHEPILAKSSKGVVDRVPIVTVPTPNIQKLVKEDEVKSASPIPLRFGTVIDVDYNLDNSGEWTNTNDGERVWQLKIKSKGALSINLNYDAFDIPKGARFFVIDPNTGSYLGAFTNRNKNPDSKFATGLLKTDEVLLQYIEPKTARFRGKIHVGQVIHGYRDTNQILKSFNLSQGCSPNVTCPQYTAYHDVKNSVAMILTDQNSRFCSGALINSTGPNCTPYILTAEHCLMGESPGDAVDHIFMFNYESPDCSNANGPVTNTVQGAILRAANAKSDFALFELNENPADFYTDIYFAGWNRENQAPSSPAIIHHPRGDIKKISIDYDPAYSSNLFSFTNNINEEFWRIVSYDVGSTEGGSSGAPLFDTQYRIVGQLYGGYAGCTSPNNTDWFGKIWYSWDKDGSSPQLNLKSWLDPIGSGALFLDGIDGNCSQAASCTDGYQNGNETGIDCGGPDCGPCSTCTDGIKNGDETGIDCGGVQCSPCGICTTGAETIIQEGFDNCVLPPEWSTHHGDSNANNISQCDEDVNNAPFSFDCTAYPVSAGASSSTPAPNFSGCVATINDDKLGFSGAAGSGCIMSPIYDLSSYTDLHLRFDYQNESTVTNNGATYVQVFNGFFWNTEFYVGVDQSGYHEIDVSNYAQSQFQVRFCYDDHGAWTYGAAFDNIELCGVNPQNTNSGSTLVPSTSPECLDAPSMSSIYAAPMGDCNDVDYYFSSRNIISSEVKITNNSDVTYDAKDEVVLKPGFEVSGNAEFRAFILGCDD